MSSKPTDSPSNLQARTACPRLEELAVFLEGELPLDQWEEITAHIDGCLPCQQRASQVNLGCLQLRTEPGGRQQRQYLPICQRREAHRQPPGRQRRRQYARLLRLHHRGHRQPRQWDDRLGELFGFGHRRRPGQRRHPDQQGDRGGRQQLPHRGWFEFAGDLHGRGQRQQHSDRRFGNQYAHRPGAPVTTS